MPTSTYRLSIMSLLRSLAELDPEVGPVELCCMWFDDLYFPGEMHPERYNHGVLDRGLQEWQTGFTADEQEAMADFHNVFEAECDALPTDWPDWDKDPG